MIQLRFGVLGGGGVFASSFVVDRCYFPYFPGSIQFYKERINLQAPDIDF